VPRHITTRQLRKAGDEFVSIMWAMLIRPTETDTK